MLEKPTFDAGHGLSRRARNAARAIAEAVFATEDGPPSADRLDWLIDDLDDFCARCGAKSRNVFRLSVFTVSTLAPLLSKKAKPFAKLSLEDRIAALEHFEKTQLGLSLLAVKAMLCIIYYEHPDVARECGFPSGFAARDREAGACIEARGAQRSGPSDSSGGVGGEAHHVKSAVSP
jgi:hypothetical protein